MKLYFEYYWSKSPSIWITTLDPLRVHFLQAKLSRDKDVLHLEFFDDDLIPWFMCVDRKPFFICIHSRPQYSALEASYKLCEPQA